MAVAPRPTAQKPSRTELDAMNEFCDAHQDGKRPDLDAFLVRHPRIARRLRPVLEGYLMFEELKPLLKQR